MKHNIIKTENYLLVVDDKKTIENWYYNESEGKVDSIKFTPNVIGGTIVHNIKAHLPLNNSPLLRGVDLLPRLEDDVKKLAECEYGTDIDSIRGSNHYDLNTDLKRGFVRGYNKAKEKYVQLIEKQISDFRHDLRESTSNHTKQNCEGALFGLKRLKQSLQKTKMPVAFDCEVTQYTVGEMSKLPLGTVNQKPKTTTNSQGITQWVGSYIYE